MKDQQLPTMIKKKCMATLIDGRCILSCFLNGVKVQMLLDSGAQVSMVGKSWMEQTLPNAVIQPLNIQDFSRLARPLFELLLRPVQASDGTKTHNSKSKGWVTEGDKGQLPSHTPILWTAQHQDVLSKFVAILTNLPILAYPNFDLPFVLHTNVSNDGLGAVL